MTPTSQPVSDMLVTVKAREIQRALFAEMRHDTTAAERHFFHYSEMDPGLSVVVTFNRTKQRACCKPCGVFCGFQRQAARIPFNRNNTNARFIRKRCRHFIAQAMDGKPEHIEPAAHVGNSGRCKCFNEL